MERRKFLQGTLSAGAAGFAVTAGIVSPSVVFAASHGGEAKSDSADPYEMKEVDAVKKALGVDAAAESADIKIKAPEVAENGAVVPVTVDAKAIDGASEIILITAENQTPLTAVYELGEGTGAKVGCRVKMGKSGDLIAIVKSGDNSFMAKKAVKVTIGGCGG